MILLALLSHEALGNQPGNVTAVVFLSFSPKSRENYTVLVFINYSIYFHNLQISSYIKKDLSTGYMIFKNKT